MASPHAPNVLALLADGALALVERHAAPAHLRRRGRHAREGTSTITARESS